MQTVSDTHQNAITQDANISKNRYRTIGFDVCSMPPAYKMISQSKKTMAISTRVVRIHEMFSDVLSKPIILIS